MIYFSDVDVVRKLAGCGFLPYLPELLGVGKEAVVWPEDIPWAPRPPERVHCWGLDGNGRDPDTAPFMEEQKLELL